MTFVCEYGNDEKGGFQYGCRIGVDSRVDVEVTRQEVKEDDEYASGVLIVSGVVIGVGNRGGQG